MTTPTPSLAALDAAWSQLPLAERQRLIAMTHLTMRSTPEKLLSRADAARRMGYSRSWLHLFLRNHWEQIPAHLRPDRQCVSNRISVAFVEWFNLEGHRVLRHPPAVSKSSGPQKAGLAKKAARRRRPRKGSR